MRLARLTAKLQALIDCDEIPGAVALILRHGEEAHCDVLGSIDGQGTPMRRDALWRLGSMTKVVTSIAALILMEEGKLRLSDRIDQWLAELRGQRVLQKPNGSLEDVCAPIRPITVEDLLTHRAGFPSYALPQGPAARMAQSLMAGSSMRPDIGVDEWLGKLAEIPLIHQPGERMVMGFSSDVLAILIQRVAGLPFEQFLQERIFGPLGMSDTVFWADESRIGRLGPAYSINWLTGKKILQDPGPGGYFSRPPAHPSGGGGLVSTADDFARLGTMLLRMGRCEDGRILSRKTVELMTTDFLTAEQRAQPYFGYPYWRDRGFGLGVFITDNIAARGGPVSVGQYGWRGAFGTYWFNDPQEDLVAVLMLPVSWPAVIPQPLADFETLVYQAIDD
ncbi:Esterase EstB [Croceibacterium atlanticum]|uniref:Esterase EstB n=2 Tax=Croceibacterium atlanticum TaxID=1267766 RepID=A0A0F7KKZ3_9SPHN|nr:serine hydrolase domain-containing protein [Croceibacterium atlanticum]AKH41233.1 Esterase EstB [Croceibacterium atlanticum]